MDLVDLTEYVRKFGFTKFFERIEILSGVRISQHAKEELRKNPHQFVFVSPDIKKLGIHSLHLLLVSSRFEMFTS
jgi:hypothetical protein